MTAGRKIASFFWWTYPRMTLEYDVMVGVILAFIFLTPRSFFRDQPRLLPQADAPFASLHLSAPPPLALNVPLSLPRPEGNGRISA